LSLFNASKLLTPKFLSQYLLKTGKFYRFQPLSPACDILR